jgi:hypothetical protein
MRRKTAEDAKNAEGRSSIYASLSFAISAPFAVKKSSFV